MKNIKPIPLIKAYRLLNIGATTMVSAKYNGVENVMSVAWVCALDYQPAMLTAVISNESFTRSLIDQSGYFAVQIPTAQQANLVIDMGESRHNNPHKIEGLSLFYQEGYDVPLVANCAGWLICKVIPETPMREKYDLIIAEIVSAWADERIFKEGHWLFDTAPDSLRTLHYVAGGQFYTIGKGLVTEKEFGS